MSVRSEPAGAEGVARVQVAARQRVLKVQLQLTSEGGRLWYASAAVREAALCYVDSVCVGVPYYT